MRFNKSIFLTFFFSLALISCKTGKKVSTGSNSDNGKTSSLMAALTHPLSEKNIYSKNVNVKKLEAFDIDEEGNIYYARLGLVNGKEKGKNKAHKVYIYKAKPNQEPQKHMTLKYFGHPYNISVEEIDGDPYLWISSNGSKHKTGKYWDEPSFSRIKYKPGKIYKKGYGGETYFLNNDKLQKTHVDINREKNLMLVAAESKRGNNWSFYTYKLSEVEALPDTTFTFDATIGGEDVDSQERTVEKRVRGHDLEKIDPIGHFTVSGDRENKPDGLNSFWLQGFSIDDHKHIYFYEGEGNRQGRLAQAYVTVFDSKGHIVGPRTKVRALDSKEDLDRAGIINNKGNLEPEGMAIKNNSLYLGFLSHQIGENKAERRAHIFRYEF